MESLVDDLKLLYTSPLVWTEKHKESSRTSDELWITLVLKPCCDGAQLIGYCCAIQPLAWDAETTDLVFEGSMFITWDKEGVSKNGEKECQ